MILPSHPTTAQDSDETRMAAGFFVPIRSGRAIQTRAVPLPPV